MPVLTQERLTRQIRDGQRGGVFFLFGEEDHLKEAVARQVVAAHLDPGTRDFNLDDVRGGDVTPETLASLIQTPPMMADHRVVVVRGAEAMAANSAFRKVLEEVSAAPPPGLALVLLADPGSSRAKLWNTLKKRATAAEFARLSDADLPGWLMAWCEERGVALEVSAARALAAAVGPDLGTLVRELEKLRDFVGDRARVTRADVEAVVGAVPRQDRWQWIDTVAERRFDQARTGLPILLETGDSGVGLVIGLANQFLRLGICITGGRRALESALPGNQRWLASKIEGQARRWTEKAVQGALEDLRRADRLLKSAPLSETQVMEELLLRLQHTREIAA